VAIIAAGGTDLYCHSEPPLTSGKLCFIINFIGRATGGRDGEFLLGPLPPFEPPLIIMITVALRHYSAWPKCRPLQMRAHHLATPSLSDATDTVAHLSTNRARRRLTSLIEANALTTTPYHHQHHIIIIIIIIIIITKTYKVPLSGAVQSKVPAPDS